MTDVYSSGLAFPGDVYTHSGYRVGHDMGLSKRDWFAGHALAGILAGGFADTIPHDDVNGGRDAAHFAYQYADAMMAVRQEVVK